MTPPPPAIAISGSASAALAIELHRFEVHPRQRADDLEVAQLLGADVHQQVFALRIVAVEPWMEYCIAAASSPFAPPNCSSSMLPNLGSGCIDPHGVHQLLHVVIHETSLTG